MARAQYLTYNGIQLALVKTNHIDFRSHRTPDGVNYLWTDVLIDINCIFNPEETSYEFVDNVPAPSPGQTPSTTTVAIEQALLQPRKHLLFGFDDDLIINSPAEDPNNPPNRLSVDADNGPTPITCDVIRIDGNKTFHVHYVIKTSIIDCPECQGSQMSQALIANRFSQVQTINREFYTEIVTRGDAYFRTDILDQNNVIADTFRKGLIPTVPLYFQREYLRFGINTAGNIISYECKDVEKPYDLGDTGPNAGPNAPFPGTYITHLEGTYNQQTATMPSGAASGQSIGTMTVRIWGSRPASNWILTQIAFKLIAIKLPIGVQQLTGNFIRHQSITQDIVNRYVEVTISMVLCATVIAPQIMGGINPTPLRVDQIVPNANGVNPQPWQDNGTRGSSGYYLLSQKLMDACACTLIQPVAAAGAGVISQVPQTGSMPIMTVSPSDIVPLVSNKYNTTTTTYPYSAAQIQSRYETNMGVIQAPVGVPTSNGTFGQTPNPNAIPTSVNVSVSNPTTRRVVDWSVERWGSTPQIPSPILADPNQTLLRWTINPVSVPILEDGQTNVFTITGQYIYALSVDITQNPIMPFDSIQWVNYPFGTFAMNLTPGGSSAVHGLIDSQNQS